MTYPVRTALALAAGLAVGAVAAADDLTIVSTVTSGKRPPATSTTYISSGRVRTSNPDNDTIFDASTGRIVMVNHKNKEYFEFTREEMAAAMQQFEQQLQQGGPMMEKMMGGPLAEVVVKKTGASRKVAGYDCDEYTVAMGETLRYDICAAPGLPVPTDYYDAVKSPFTMIGPMSRRFEKMFEEMKKIKGFPVAMTSSVKVMMVHSDLKSEVTEIKKGPIADAVFAIPAGYRKKDSPFRK
jgi:hypothetical protein